MKNRLLTVISFLSITLFSNAYGNDKCQTKETSKITCTEKGCHGTYKGAEFVNRSDVAHQFSNKMSAKVGDKLKELFNKGTYTKVDFYNTLNPQLNNLVTKSGDFKFVRDVYV